MSGFALSDQQRAVVEDRGGSLLVSAAAGSGKTRVLVERLFRYITEDRCQVDDFLIITFTRAAAAELRSRIAEELNERIALAPNDRHLRRQLMRLYRTEIKTIDAFCAGLLRENIHLLPADGKDRRLTGDFRALDEREAVVLQARVLEDTLDQYYERIEQTGGSTALADSFGFGRSDSKLGALVSELYQKTQSHAEPERWLRENREKWEAIAAGGDTADFLAPLLLRFVKQARYWARFFTSSVERFAAIEPISRAYGDAYAETAERLTQLADAAEKLDFTALSAAEDPFVRVKPLRTKPPKDCSAEDWLWDEEELKAKAELYQQQRDKAKETIKKSLAVCSVPAEVYREELRLTAPAMVDLLRLTEDYSRAYSEEKTRRNVADFSDQEHAVLRLLYTGEGGKTELAERVAARYREIMVDEYQDTNEVQDRLFAAVSKEGKNLFCVGDVKQSIYRFRLADPGIFLKKYKSYPDASAAKEGEPRRIILSRNYRSRREVLAATNFIFRNIFSEDFGELAYGEEEELRLGRTDYFENPDAAPEFHLLDFTSASEEAESSKRSEAEARYVAKRIDTLLRSGYSVQGPDGKPRPVQPEDIAVLMRSPKERARLYHNALAERNVPCSMEREDDFYNTLEIAVCFQLLQIIDNPHEDVPLISVLSSPLFGFTPDELARIRAKTPKGDFYTALSASDEPRAAEFLEHLGRLRSLAGDMSVSELLGYLYDEENMLSIFGVCEGGGERRENLKLFLRHAKSMEDAGYRDLFSFVAELRRRLASDAAPPTPPKGAVVGVRLMSIHASKGLEYPVVVLADLGHGFNEQDHKEPVLVHTKLGLGPQFIDLKRRIRYPTIAHTAVAEQLRSEMKAEELRILYVAMTRAREKLIMVMSMQDAKKKLKDLMVRSSLPVDTGVLASAKSHGEWLLLPLLMRAEAEPLYAYAEEKREEESYSDDEHWDVRVEDLRPYTERFSRAAEEAAEEEKDEPIAFDPDLLNFRYPYARDTELATVFSASSLAKDADAAAAPHRREMKRPAFLTGETVLSGAEAGTATHLLMQYIDFATPASEETLQEELDRIRREQRITEAQAKAIRTREVLRFLASPIADELRTAKELHREYQFSYLMDARRIDTGASEGERVLLHGVIDCWYVNADGETVVLDFKTDRVYGEALAERAEEYRTQVELYAEALSSIFERKVERKYLYFFSEDRLIALN